MSNRLSGYSWYPSRCKKWKNALAMALQTEIPNKSSRQLVKWANLVRSSLTIELAPGTLILPQEEESFHLP